MKLREEIYEILTQYLHEQDHHMTGVYGRKLLALFAKQMNELIPEKKKVVRQSSGEEAILNAMSFGYNNAIRDLRAKVKEVTG